MSPKDIIFGLEGRQKIASGIDKLANAVKVTLGPCGRNVILQKSYDVPVITKDGVSVAREVILQDPFENIGAQMVNEVASKTAEVSGDGTTTATILAQAIFREGHKHIAAGHNPMELKVGIEKAVNLVVGDIENRSIRVSSRKETQQVATISSNSDKFIGDQIAEAMERVGRYGVITVEEAKGIDSELEIVVGTKIDRGYISSYFVTDQEKMECVLDNPLIFLYEKKISNVKSIVSILEKAAKASRSLLIIAEDIEGDALTTLVVNKMRGTLNVAAIRAPGFGDSKIDSLNDIALLTGATVISENLGTNISDSTFDDLGGAKKVIVSKSSCIIVDGTGCVVSLAEHIQNLKKQSDKIESDYDKKKIEERIAKLSGGVAIIKVGAATELELKEKKDRVDDALHATRAAVEEGIVPGGGVALLRAKRIIDKLELNGSQKYGAEIVSRALEEPLRIIASNAGFESSVIIEKVMNSASRIGFDVCNNEFVDMMDRGIIDPAKVVRVALQNASSIASLMLTTECMIAEIPKKDDKKEEVPSPMGMPSRF